MTQSPIFLTPVFKEKIWGGTALRDIFGYGIPSETTGECWAISAHPKGPSTITNGPYKGKTLTELWDEHREVFGCVEGERFPLLTKLLDVKEDMSIKVHPDDYYAGENEEENSARRNAGTLSTVRKTRRLSTGIQPAQKPNLSQ